MTLVKKDKGYTLIPCDKCNGSGKIKGNDCPKCKGSGKVKLLTEKRQ